ncbi:AAA family ATPase [Halorussus aquaticus]|uniref:AAA family ATPase n=1 Tax=Halorussus aquaticus TaxID=2953748 RepID=A0ABD5Q8M2_9EURY|nr:AAA family ATPase [Halorussus aquaticus]
MADELGVGSHRGFSSVEMLFLAWFRILQADMDIRGAPLSQPRLNSILRETYTVPTDTDGTDELDDDHPLAEHVSDTQPTVYKFTAPPDYWLTTYEYAALGLEEGDQNDWQDIQAGDVILFHSTGSPGWEALQNQESGIIGAGIVRAKTTKPDEKTWWFDERDGRPKDDSFPYLVAFERLYATGDIDEIDFTNDIYAKSSATVDADLELLTDNSLDFDEADEISREASGSGFPRYQMIKPLNGEQARGIITALTDKLHEVPSIAIDKSFDGELDPDEILDGLYFPSSIGEEIVAQIEGALRVGKHIILTGPPGTGKTEIARRVANYLAEEYPHLYSGSQVTTATADWSTFDTVGGYMPNEDGSDGDHLEFTPGLVLNRFKTRSTNVQRNESLVIDELNRADIDKAFGQLFTVLSGQPVQLPYTKKGKEVDLAPVDERSVYLQHEYRIPNSWSLFATLNTYDKTSLYEMSYAFMRRFSFIRVPAPDLETLNDAGLGSLLKDYDDVWNTGVQDIDETQSSQPLVDVGQVWQAANGAIDDRAIGPAVVKDILEYLTETRTVPWSHRLTQAVISYVLPQLEGVPKRDRVVRSLANVDQIEARQLDRASRDMLQVAAIQDTDE